MNDSETLKRLLLVSLDDVLKTSLSDPRILRSNSLTTAHSPAEALTLIEHQSFDIIFLDIDRLRPQEMDLVHYARSRSSNTEIIVLASIGELEEARNSLRNGASFYLIKPIAFGDLKVVIEQILKRIERNREHIALEQQAFTDLMAGNLTMEKVLKLAIKIAPTTSTVLIGGESGTGKEFFAKIIHRMSNRANANFVAMNCGAIPDSLFESELFGHRKGAFTGADRDKPGLVEEANLGTLFLDEVGELSPSAQVKLLRFLQEQTFRRLGETTQRTGNVRVIAATNRDLHELMRDGTFREDLFYRLNVFYLHLPPLRERRETIPTLIKLFVHRFNTVLDKHINSISKPAEVLLANYPYPGNVRELENIIEHAMVLADDGAITEKELPEFMFRSRALLTGPDRQTPTDQRDAAVILPLDRIEKAHIELALSLTSFSYSEAAKKLGISRSTLWRKIKLFKIMTPRGDQSKKADL